MKTSKSATLTADAPAKPENDAYRRAVVGDARPEPDRFLKDGFPNPAAMDVWEYMRELTEEQWQKHIIYLYRINPTVSRIPGQPAYLDKYAGPISIADIAERYGGLEYRLDLIRTDTHRNVYRHRFPIDATPKNAHGEKFEGQPAAAAPGSANGSQNDQMLSVVQTLLEQRDETPDEYFDPRAAVSEAIKIQAEGAREAIKLIAEQKSGGGDSMIIKLLLPALIQQAFGKPQPDAAAAVNPVAQLRDVLGVVNELRGGEPGAPLAPAAATNNVWVALAQSVGPRLETILEKVGGLLERWAAVQAASQGRRPAIPLPAVQQQPAQHLGGDVVLTAVPPAAVPIAPEAKPAGPVVFDRRAIVRDAIKERIIEMLFGGDDGQLAAEVADRMDPDFADELARTLRENPAGVAADPILGRAIQSPALEPFVTRFLSYFDETPAGIPPAPGAEDWPPAATA
jgi:hypothetical protein